jgi:hypothetical protein
MRKKGVELSLHSLIGILMGVAIAIGIIFVVIPFIEVFTQGMHGEDEDFLENSLDEFVNLVYGLNEGDKKDMLFYSYGQFDIYLNTYNNDSSISECFLVPCIALCSDSECEEILFHRALSNDVVFENSGIITKIDVEEGNSGRFLLYVEKRNSSITLSLS